MFCKSLYRHSPYSNRAPTFLEYGELIFSRSLSDQFSKSSSQPFKNSNTSSKLGRLLCSGFLEKRKCTSSLYFANLRLKPHSCHAVGEAAIQNCNHAQMWVWLVGPPLLKNPGSCPACKLYVQELIDAANVG